MITHTYTFVTVEVTKKCYEEIATILRNNGYDHAFMENGEIDMHGLALICKEDNNDQD